MKKTKLLQKIAIGGALLVCVVCGVLIYGNKAHSLPEDGQNQKVESDGAKDGGEEAPSVTDLSIPVIPAESEDPMMTGIPGAIVTEEPMMPADGIWGTIRGAGKSEVIARLSEGGRTIVISKKESGYERATIELEEFHTERKIRLFLSGIQEEISAEQVLRVSTGTLCQGMPPTPTPMPTPTLTSMPTSTLTSTPTETPTASLTPIPTTVPTLSPEDPLYEWRFDPVKEIEMNTWQQEDGSFAAEILITLDKTYVYQLYEDEWNYYLSLERPKEVYPKIIVIDAGHGGLDIGTYSAGYTHYEKTVCLNVLLYLKELLDAQKDIQVYYTRTTDWKPSLMQRVNLANDVEADFFLSIHCNGSESRSLNGTEVLYSAAQNNWEGMNSKKFARICQDKLLACLGLKDRGLVPRDHNVTIIQQAQVPVALVELAFMSNASDMEILEKEETQRNIAKALYEAILEGYERLEEMESENERAE